MQDVVVPIDMGGGIDTKTDPKLVIPANFQLIQNGIFTTPKRITKRNGYDAMTLTEVGTGGGVISNITMDATYRDELLVAATGSKGPNRLFSYSETLGGWQDRGYYASVSVSKQIINSAQFQPTGQTTEPYGSCNSSCVSSGNITLYAFDSSGATYGTPIATYITIVDQETGQHLCDQVQIASAIGYSKAALLAPGVFSVFYIIGGNLYFSIITITDSGGVSVGAGIEVGACASTSGGPQFVYAYDFAITSSGTFIVALANAGDVVLYTITSGGTVSSPATITSTGNIIPVSLCPDSSNNVWIYYWYNGTTLAYAIYSASLSSVLGQTTIKSISTPISQITAYNFDSTHQQVYYSTHLPPSSTGAQANSLLLYEIITSKVSSAGVVVTPSAYLYNLDIYGKVFMVNGRPYMPVINPSQSQSTGFLIDVLSTTQNASAFGSIPAAAAKFLQDEAEAILESSYDLTGGSSPVAGALVGVRFPGFINTAQSLSTTQFLLGAGYVINLVTEVLTSTTTTSVWPALLTTSVNLGVCGITFDFDNIDAFQAFQQQDTLVVNGGIVGMYDGAYTDELGYNIDADNLRATAASNNGSITEGTYGYSFTYEWIDANGNLYESAPSPEIFVYFSSASTTNSVGLIAPSIPLTQKTNVIIKFWRSDSNLGGNLSYFIGSIQCSPDNLDLGFTDKLITASASSNPTLYTQNGAILDNIAPPPSMILWQNNNRLWCIDSENPETNIEYTKTAAKGYGILFSTGLLELVIDSYGGDITGASRMDEKTVILKENNALGFFIGDGANDSGTGSTITNFQFVPTDAGCTNSKSVILYPGGILFRTTKGIYELNRGIQTNYFGMAVEGYNSQDIQSVLIVPNKNQIRFLTSNGSSLLYDYVMGKWSVFTNHAGLCATNWQGSYVYVRSNNNAQDENAIFIEDENSFLDNETEFNVALQTAWLAISSVQNFQRCKMLSVLGDFDNGSSSGHGVQIQAAYDFSPTFLEAIPYLFGSASASGVFQYRNFFSRQKCDAISLLITEITTGVSGEYFDLTNLSFTAGIKKGTNKLPASQSVG